VLPVAARNEQTATLALPAGAAAVFLEPDPAFARVADTIVLTPLAPAAWTGMNATGTARYGGVDVFFQGNAAVFPEADRVWVRGGHTAALTLAPPAGTTHAMLSIGNGEAVNDVTLVSSAGEWRFRLAPGSSRTVRVPLTADGTAAVRISSSAGFRPSESGGDPNDHRYLGVWVTVTPGGESAEP
jgi:hypothetical protein